MEYIAYFMFEGIGLRLTTLQALITFCYLLILQGFWFHNNFLFWKIFGLRKVQLIHRHTQRVVTQQKKVPQRFVAPKIHLMVVASYWASHVHSLHRSIAWSLRNKLTSILCFSKRWVPTWSLLFYQVDIQKTFDDSKNLLVCAFLFARASEL